MRIGVMIAMMVAACLAIALLPMVAAEEARPLPMDIVKGASFTASTDDSTASATKASIACMIVWSVIMLLGFCYWGCSTRFVPKPGTLQIFNNDGTPRQYTVGGRKWVPVSFAAISFILKLVGMAINNWTIVDYTDADVTERYGVLGSYVSMRGGSSTYTKYDCSGYNQAGMLTTYKACNAQRAGGVLTLISGILTLLLSVLLILLSLSALRSPAVFTKRALTMWRVSGLCYFTGLGAYMYWVTGAYINIIWFVNEWNSNTSSTTYLSASWWLFLVAPILDSIVGWFLRKAIKTSPPEGGANGFAPMGVVVVPGQAPYQQLPGAQSAYVGSYPVVAAVPQGPAYANGMPVGGSYVQPVQYQQAPQGYGPPQSYGAAQYGQPQQYVGQPQQVAYQPPNPAAYNPNAYPSGPR